MKNFVLKEICTKNMTQELEQVGFDKTYTTQGALKFKYKNIKIYSLTNPQANILKQTALSVGADCATHREVITAKVEKSDCILGGSISQLKKISSKLAFQPFGLKALGEEIEKFISYKKSGKTKIVGILNLTPDSFSDGGEFLDYEKAKEHFQYMISSGADIIDIGAESTRPYSTPVSGKAQIERIIPILKFAKENGILIPISVDTRSAEVAEKCILEGAQIINDVSGLDYDKNMVDVIAKYGVKVIIQHSLGDPQNMQDNPRYESLMDEIYLKLREKVDFALSKGIAKENIIVDPGIGFGKTRDDNFEIIRRVEEFYGLGCEVMLGVSRKSLLGMKEETNEMKDIFTVALNALALENKVDYIRVHNVPLHKRLLECLR